MLQQEGLAGAIYSIVEGDATRVAAVGLANAELGEPLRAQTKVHIGSVIKTLVALGST